MEINQQDAAKDLGWTQGAFSQYLNSITKLNTAAVIKIANYLGVPASSIDPDISEKLPTIHSIKVRYQNSDTTPIKNKGMSMHLAAGSGTSFCVEITEITPIAPDKAFHPGAKVIADHSVVVQKKLRKVTTPRDQIFTFSTKSPKDKKFTWDLYDLEGYLRIDPNKYNKHFTVVSVYLL